MNNIVPTPKYVLSYIDNIIFLDRNDVDGFHTFYWANVFFLGMYI